MRIVGKSLIGREYCIMESSGDVAILSEWAC